MVVSVPHTLFDSQSVSGNPNANPLCGRMLRAQRFDGRAGRTVSADLKVVDRCKLSPSRYFFHLPQPIQSCFPNLEVSLLTSFAGVGCQPTDLDVSPAAFNTLADPALGRVHDMSWAWI